MENAPLPNVGLEGLNEVINSPLFSLFVKDFIVFVISMSVLLLIMIFITKFNSDYPKREMFIKEGAWKKGTRRVYGNMLVSTNDVYRAIVFGDIIVGPPEEDFQAQPFLETGLFGNRIVMRYFARSEKGNLLPYRVDDEKGIIELSNKMYAVKEIGARWINAIRKAEAISKKSNPLMAMLMSYLPYIVFMFLFLIFFYFVGSGIQNSMERSLLALKEISDKQHEIITLLNATKG